MKRRDFTEEQQSTAEAVLRAVEPEVVYHYTTMDTMIKIVSSNSIWATSINYLNDVSERDHFRCLIRDRIPTYIENHDLETQKSGMLNDFLTK